MTVVELNDYLLRLHDAESRSDDLPTDALIAVAVEMRARSVACHLAVELHPSD